MEPAFWRRGIAGVLLLIATCAAAAQDGGDHVIWLVTQQTTGKDMGQGLLIREQVRQAILIAARDEMGLSTRDAALREFDPASPQATEVNLKVDLRRALHVEIVRNGAKIWAGEMGLKVGAALHDHLTESCEKWSRKQFVEALTLAGFAPVARNADQRGAEVGNDIMALLARMNFVSQFDAVRRLHQAIHEKGSSRTATAALVRGYANLGALTELQWYAADRVFKARALLYAQRLVAAEPHSAFALWHRAYARAMAGFYGAALSDLASAAKVANPAVDGGPAPVWVAEIQAMCKYDATALNAIVKQTPNEASLAYFLELLNVVGSANAGEVLEKGKLALQADPENPYALERMTDAAGVSYGHLMTVNAPRIFIGQTLLQTLPACAQLPAEVSARITALQNGKADATTIAAIWEALVAGGADPKKDAGEPSWGALGRLVQETHFLQIWQRAAFLRYKLGDGSDATDFVKQSLPMIGKDHPFKSFIESFEVDYTQEPQRYDDLISGVTLIDVTAATRHWMNYAQRSKPKGLEVYKKESEHLYGCTDGVARDLETQYRLWNNTAWKVSIAKQLMGISPHSPYAMGELVANEWKTRRAKAAEYEKWAPGCSYLLGVLGRMYMTDNRPDDAARCFKLYLDVAKDAWVYEDLADLHLKQGDEASWLASLETYIRESEDFGLSHANVRVRIARGLMSRGKYHQALPYAEAAAQTGAGWAIDAAAECHEGLGDVREAAALYRDSAERYDADCFTYWFWYCRSKDPNSAGSEKLVSNYIANTRLINHDQLAAFYLIKGDCKAAREAYGPLDEATMSSYGGLQIALAADAAGDVALRDQALQKVIDQKQSPLVRPGFVNLARLFQAALASPDAKLDLNALDQLIAKKTAASQLEYDLMAGRFLQKRGENRDAMRYLRAAIQGSAMSGAGFNIAWHALAQMGLDPRTLREPVKDR